MGGEDEKKGETSWERDKKKKKKKNSSISSKKIKYESHSCQMLERFIKHFVPKWGQEILKRAGSSNPTTSTAAAAAECG